MNNPLGINIQVGTGFGWGIVALNLVLEFCRSGIVCPVLTLPPGDLDLDSTAETLLGKAERGWLSILEFYEKYPDQAYIVDFPVLFCGGNFFQHRMTIGTSCERYSITVFENSNLGERTDEEKDHFHKILAGSQWNAEILKSQGFHNVGVWNQGVDIDLFCPGTIREWQSDKFLIFSGGKLEFRKGQDLVVAAFRIFQERHADAMLITAWDSPWAHLGATFTRSRWVQPPVGVKDGQLDVVGWLASEGISADQVLNVGAVPNREMPEILRRCDVALFPNRAEGATNLFAMEAIACGVPSILSANTGHLDLLEEVPALRIETQESVVPLGLDDGVDGWGESDIEEMVELLESTYQNRDGARINAMRAVKDIRSRSWANRAQALTDSLLLSD